MNNESKVIPIIIIINSILTMILTLLFAITVLLWVSIEATKETRVEVILIEKTPPPQEPTEDSEPLIEQNTAQVIDQKIEEDKISRGTNFREFDFIDVKLTAYSLSYASCKKSKDHPEYGITFSGKKAQVNQTVAVDPKVIPLGSILYIEFPDKYSFRNGTYIAEDVGSAVKGNHIDVFFGEDEDGESVIEDLVDTFGVQQGKVYILERGR